MATEIHVTRVVEQVGHRYDVYGHETSHCDEAGCNGTERYYGSTDPDGGNIDVLTGEAGDDGNWEPRAGDTALVREAAAEADARR